MPNKRKRLVGRVVSDKMDKTVVVAIDISRPHPIYKKVVRSTKKVYAHDDTNEILIGTMVRVVESRPMSKLKRWVVEEVIRETGNMVVEPVAMEAQDEPEIEAVMQAAAAPEAEPVEVEVEAVPQDVAPEAEPVEAEVEAVSQDDAPEADAEDESDEEDGES